MILLYSFHRENIFPVDDRQLKLSLIKYFDLEDNKNLKKEMLDISASWQPFRSLAVLHIFEFDNQHIKRKS